LATKKQGKVLFDGGEKLEYKIAKILLYAGADVNLKTKLGKTPFSLSFESGLIEMIKLFG